jgi:hypothetical protein
MPHISRLKSERRDTPVFDEDRVTNANALLRLVHISVSMPQAMEFCEGPIPDFG